ncbi:MAG: DUF4251 domain-containing protein, partial [Mucinivorans sp.]
IMLNNLIFNQYGILLILRSCLPCQTLHFKSTHHTDLTLGNDFIFTKSQITSRLPFYGRLDSAPIDANQGPLAFTSTDFTYKISDGKKATKIVQIQVKRSKSTMAGGAYSVMLEIFSDATATLNVTIGSGGRSTFFGYVQQINEGI